MKNIFEGTSLLDPKLIEILKKAGQIAIQEQTHLNIQYKKDSSIVTNGDILVSKFLTTELKKLYPTYDIFSEETAEQKPKSNSVIIIDPIDGTTSYAKKEDNWCLLLGFVRNEIVETGVVYQPTLNLLYWAKKGQGAYLVEGESTPQRLSAEKGFPLIGICSKTDAGENIVFEKLGITEVKRMFSASLKIIEVAKGNYDIYPYFQRKCSVWDLVAPQLILEEAGGLMIYEDEFKIDYANPLLKMGFAAINKNVDRELVAGMIKKQ